MWWVVTSVMVVRTIRDKHVHVSFERPGGSKEVKGEEWSHFLCVRYCFHMKARNMWIRTANFTLVASQDLRITHGEHIYSTYHRNSAFWDYAHAIKLVCNNYVKSQSCRGKCLQSSKSHQDTDTNANKKYLWFECMKGTTLQCLLVVKSHVLPASCSSEFLAAL